MKKFIDFFKFFLKATFLITLLIFGWAFINVTNLIKGKKAQDKDADWKSVFGPNQADADVFGGPGPGPKVTTPFLAYFDGKEYRLENDILFGRPNSFYHQYTVAKALYEDGRIFPDLYKITSHIKPIDGKLLFQIQEIEPEESFFKWLELDRVVHLKNTEVMVDSDFKKFHVFDKNRFEQKMVLPSSIIDDCGKDCTKALSNKELLWQYSPASDKRILFQSNESVEVLFKNLKTGEIPYLITKTRFRDWVAGETNTWLTDTKMAVFDLFTASGLQKAAAAFMLFMASWVYHKIGFVPEYLTFLPLMAGFHACNCLTYGYKDGNGEYHWISINDVRTWKYNNEVVELPREAVNSNGELKLRVMATKRHALGFIGVVQEDDLNAASSRNYRMEKLTLHQAYHNRLRKDVSGTLKKGYWEEYLHTIPGDKINLEFDASSSELNENEKETYLLRSSGFYTSLRPEYKKIAGNWQERISEEAKSRLATLVPVSKYK